MWSSTYITESVHWSHTTYNLSGTEKIVAGSFGAFDWCRTHVLPNAPVLKTFVRLLTNILQIGDISWKETNRSVRTWQQRQPLVVSVKAKGLLAYAANPWPIWNALKFLAVHPSPHLCGSTFLDRNTSTLQSNIWPKTSISILQLATPIWWRGVHFDSNAMETWKANPVEIPSIDNDGANNWEQCKGSKCQFINLSSHLHKTRSWPTIAETTHLQPQFEPRSTITSVLRSKATIFISSNIQYSYTRRALPRLKLKSPNNALGKQKMKSGWPDLLWIHLLISIIIEEVPRHQSSLPAWLLIRRGDRRYWDYVSD
jgi:hypothetical protein